MSDKIYNGSYIPAMGTVELLKFLKRLQPKFERAVQTDIDARIVRMGVREYDLRTLGLTETKNSIFTIVSRDLEDMFEKKKWFSTKCEVALFPLKDKILTIFYGEREFEAIWNKTKGVKFYGYWNSSDADEKCSAKEWNQRKRDWNKVLIGDNLSGIPALDGFGFQFTTHMLWNFLYVRMPGENCMKNVPDMDFRIQMMAEHIATTKLKAELQNQENGHIGENRIKERAEEYKKDIVGKLTIFTDFNSIFKKKWD